MKLLKLYSSNSKFKTIKFNQNLNIIIGKQISKEEKKTFNGVGKSLSLSLVHYILGAKLSDKKLKDYLSTYGSFTLDLEHNGERYSIEKDFSTNLFTINKIEYPKKKYTQQLNNIFIGKTSDVSFREFFNCFARRYGELYYSNALTQQGMNENDFGQKLVNFKLIGIDTSLVQKKKAIKEDINNLNKAKKFISDYEKKIDQSNISDIADEIIELKNQIDQFKIAKNFESLKAKADKLTKKANQIRNEKYLLNNTLKKKEYIYKQSKNININPEQICSIYNEVEFFFNDSIEKRLEDAQEFHNSLIHNRKLRLHQEVKELTKKTEELESDLRIITNERDSILQVLNTSGAIEELISLKDHVQSLEKKKHELEKYKFILTDFKVKENQFKIDNSKVQAKGLEYIIQSKKHIDEIEKIFRSYVKRFYDTTGGTLELRDTKDAKYLFDLIVSIPKEESQGVGEVKIFCYDILLYILNKNVLNFLAHDGAIFSEMDPRQKATIFKIILELIEEYDLQYFVNINENSFKEVINNTIKTEDARIIKSNIVCDLLDDKPENWLFGESFN